MRRDAGFHGLCGLLACTLIFLVAGSSPAASLPSSSQAAGGAPASMTGTVRAVDAKARTLEVITGVGHALRLVRMGVAPACNIKVAGAAAGLGGVKPGHVVRVGYLAAPGAPKAPGAQVAQSIETLPVEGMGGTR